MPSASETVRILACDFEFCADDSRCPEYLSPRRLRGRIAALGAELVSDDHPRRAVKRYPTTILTTARCSARGAHNTMSARLLSSGAAQPTCFARKKPSRPCP